MWDGSKLTEKPSEAYAQRTRTECYLVVSMSFSASDSADCMSAVTLKARGPSLLADCSIGPVADHCNQCELDPQCSQPEVQVGPGVLK